MISYAQSSTKCTKPKFTDDEFYLVSKEYVYQKEQHHTVLIAFEEAKKQVSSLQVENESLNVIVEKKTEQLFNSSVKIANLEYMYKDLKKRTRWNHTKGIVTGVVVTIIIEGIIYLVKILKPI